MVNRLIKIAALTGAAHLFTIITLKLLSERVSAKEISLFGEVDAIFLFMFNMIGFGLQLSAVRNIASSENWKEEFHQTQVARNTLGILLMPAALLYFLKAPYQYFFLAPIFALNGDYALYGRGKPVLAAILAFWRVFIPSLFLVAFTFWRPAYIIQAYVISSVGVVFLTGIFISKWLKTPYWHPPKLKSLVLYAQSFYLGIASLSNYFIGLGFIIVAAQFYDNIVVAASYLGLKLYMIYKGLIRIINQAFIKEMLDDAVCFKVDQLACIAGLGFVAVLSIFPKSFISIFFNEQYDQHQIFLFFVSAAGLTVSFLTSYSTRSLLKHKDKSYAIYSAVAVIVSFIIMIILSYFFQSTVCIGIALLTGELITAWGLFQLNRDIAITGRFQFLVQSSLLLLLPFSARMIAGDHIFTMVVGMSLLAAGGGWLIYKKFSKLPSINTHSI